MNQKTKMDKCISVVAIVVLKFMTRQENALLTLNSSYFLLIIGHIDADVYLVKW